MNEQSASLLVVDDNLFCRTLLKASLSEQGQSVQLAQHGKEGLEKLKTGSFDLVLLDLLMADIDGFEMLRIIQADSRLRGLSVVMVSGEEDRSEVTRCIEMGAEDYLTKPVDGTLLRARVKRCVEQKRLKDQEAGYQQELER